jgi:hypothetical protein
VISCCRCGWGEYQEGDQCRGAVPNRHSFALFAKKRFSRRDGVGILVTAPCGSLGKTPSRQRVVKTHNERSNRSFDGVCVEEDTPHTGGCIL